MNKAATGAGEAEVPVEVVVALGGVSAVGGVGEMDPGDEEELMIVLMLAME